MNIITVNYRCLILIAFIGVLGVLTVRFTQAQAVCTETVGRMERTFYDAPSIDTRMAYSVYLPPCYDQSGTAYPVLYLMHGSNDDDNQWFRLGIADTLDARISLGELPPMIVVFPFGNWIANENRFNEASWDEVFLTVLMPLVETSYRVEGGRATRAIGGISRGGFWAFNLAMTNPLLFSAVGGHSAFFDLNNAPPEENPLDLASDGVGVDALRIALDRGVDDFAAPGLDIMDGRLTERGIAHNYTIYPEGEHNNDYWRQHVSEYLDFYVADWLDRSQPISEPTPEVTPEATPLPELSSETVPNSDGTYYLLLPVVAFPSTQANIGMERLQSIRAGLIDNNLVLSDDVAATLQSYGVTLPPGLPTIPADALYNTLSRDRTKFTLLPFDQLTPRYRVLNVDELRPLDSDLSVYPFAFPSDTPNYDRAHLTRILFSGVTALTRDTRTALDNNGVAWAAEGIAPFVQRPDFFHTSNEVSFFDTCPQTNGPLLGGSFSFCSEPSHFDLFSLLDLDIVELSGNHNNDYGYDAYLDTLQWYRDNGILTVGGGATVDEARQPLLIDHNGNTVALVSCNWVGPYYAWANDDPIAAGGVRPGAAQCDHEWLQGLLPTLAAANDLVVVTVQFLEADQYTPSTDQQIFFRQLADWGADVVIGTSSHYPQTFEFYPSVHGDVLIHYGLGNLFFDQDWFAGVRFFMDQVYIYEGRFLRVDLFPGIIEGYGRPRPMDATERENFLFLIFNEYGGM